MLTSTFIRVDVMEEERLANNVEIVGVTCIDDEDLVGIVT